MFAAVEIIFGGTGVSCHVFCVWLSHELKAASLHRWLNICENFVRSHGCEMCLWKIAPDAQILIKSPAVHRSSFVTTYRSTSRASFHRAWGMLTHAHFHVYLFTCVQSQLAGWSEKRNDAEICTSHSGSSRKTMFSQTLRTSLSWCYWHSYA